MTISDDIKTALDLDAKATGGPWYSRRNLNSHTEMRRDADASCPSYVVENAPMAATPEGWAPVNDADTERYEKICVTTDGFAVAKANADAITQYRTLAPRLAAWAQRVMPLVKRRRGIGRQEPSTWQAICRLTRCTQSLWQRKRTCLLPPSPSIWRCRDEAIRSTTRRAVLRHLRTNHRHASAAR